MIFLIVKKDDYGRPFVDPKGSRTFMDDDEIEKIMNRLGEKLSTKKASYFKRRQRKKKHLVSKI